MVRRKTVTIGAMLTVLLPSTAIASRRFPEQIASELGLSYQPACSLCHSKGNTGPGTVSTPVGLSLKARGLQPGGRASVSTSLAALDRDHTDSDGDGVADVDELRSGSDPNSPEPTSAAGRADPAYGCGGGRSQGRNDAQGPLPVMLAACVGWARRRRGVPRA
jgi:hypothetical protein